MSRSECGENVLRILPVAGFTVAIIDAGNMVFFAGSNVHAHEAFLAVGSPSNHKGVVMKHATRMFAVFILLISAAVPAALAQSTTGSISGSVVDDSGAVIPGATVTATNRGTGMVRTTGSGSGGDFTLPYLPSGSYDVMAELSGFRPTRATNVEVTVGTDVTLKLTLKLGIEESVTIIADAPLVEMTRSGVASTVNETMVENLPTNGRNFIDFVLTTPGVVKDVRLGDISFAGQRGTLNSLVVDGADNNNTFFGQALGRTGSGRAPYQFSQDAVKEFQVNSNAYSAEYGRAGGAVINVITKSGTNELRGGAFFFYRDRDLASNSYFNERIGRRKGPYQYDQYGASLGGPIVRDKHFFFINYDGQRNTIPNTVSLGVTSFPTDPDTQAGLERLRALANSWERGQNQDVFLVKTDHEVMKSHLSFRYNKQDFTGKNFENGGSTNSEEHTGDSVVQTDTYTLNVTTPISGSFFNEVRAQYARDKEPGKANSANPEAIIRQGGATVLVIGRNFFSPRETTIERTQVADTLTYLRDAHTFKAGFDINQDDILNYFPGNFSGSYTFTSVASFQRGRPTGSGERYVQAFPGPGTSGPITHPNLFETAVFVQDEWRATPSLTINAGVRYDRIDIEQPEIRNPDAQLLAAGIDTSVVPEDDNNIGLRLGFAYNPRFSPRTLVRGGYGTFYGRTPAIMIGTAHSNNGINVQTITFTGDQVPTYPNILPSIPTGVAIPKPTIFVFDKDYENPTVHQGSLGVEQAVSTDLSVAVSYLWVRGEDLSRSTDINVGEAEIATLPISTGGSVSFRRYPTTRPFTNFHRIIEFQSSAESEYNGLTFDVNKRFSSRWQARLSYTYGQVKDNKPDQTAVVPQSSDDTKFAWDPVDFDVDWGYGDNDVRHRATLSGVWSLPFGEGSESVVARYLLSGWTISGIANYQTGQPYSAIVNTDLNRDGNTRNDRAPGFERNQFRLPSQFTFDPRITKDVPLGGEVKLQLIAEAFNLFNDELVTFERSAYYNFTNGQLVPISSFGTVAGSTDPRRVVQLAAKLSF